jgi:hypothetical protein
MGNEPTANSSAMMMVSTAAHARLDPAPTIAST